MVFAFVLPHMHVYLNSMGPCSCWFQTMSVYKLIVISMVVHMHFEMFGDDEDQIKYAFQISMMFPIIFWLWY